MHDGFSVSEENSREKEKKENKATLHHKIWNANHPGSNKPGDAQKTMTAYNQFYRRETLQNWKKKIEFQQYKQRNVSLPFILTLDLGGKRYLNAAPFTHGFGCWFKKDLLPPLAHHHYYLNENLDEQNQLLFSSGYDVIIRLTS